MILKLTALCLLLCLHRFGAEPLDLINYKLVDIQVKDESQFQLVKQLRDIFKFEFANKVTRDFGSVLIVLDPSHLVVLKELDENGIGYQIVSDNVQQLVNEERTRISQLDAGFDFNNSYHKFDDISKELQDIASHANYSKLSNLKWLGSSFKNKKLPGIVLTNPGSSTKKMVVLECGIHAREWISPAACLFIIKELISNPDNKARMDKYEFAIIPVTNPDGYDYTWSDQRMWRKTRSKSKSSTCIGTDGNRNWDAGWGKQGASSNPCSDSYRGDKVFSESETKGVSDYVLANKDKIAAYFSIHCCTPTGHMMWPFGYKRTAPADDQTLKKLATDAQAAMKKPRGKNYKIGKIVDVMYIASGSSIDWSYEKAGVKLSFAFETASSNGFLVPTKDIVPTSQEIWLGIKSVIDQI